MQLQEMKHIWSNVTLNEPKFNCNSYTTIDNTLGGGGELRYLGEKLPPFPPPPPLDRTLHILCPSKSVGELTLGAGDT